MKPEKFDQNPAQTDMFKPLLKDLIDPAHPLVRLANAVDWQQFEQQLEPCFGQAGRPAKSVRLMVGLHYLKYTFNHSDESALATWIENPYWQFFCGGVYFEHDVPIDPSSMTRWRGYLEEAGCEAMLAETIRTGLREKFIPKSQLKRVNVDTTVQEKNIRFPTDVRLLDRSRERLVRAAKERHISLRQSYKRVGKKVLRQHGGYVHAQQFNRARGVERKLRTILGRVVRDIERRCPRPGAVLREELEMARRLLVQKRKSKNKLYSLHEPQTQCIAKGKAHKRYEFGCKASFVTSSRGNWVLGAQALHGNPYDGHTLSGALAQAESLTGTAINQAVCDLGYRGHNYEGETDVQIVRRSRKKLPRSLKNCWKRRSAIEPVIGHLKSEHRLDRNRLGGVAGDKINAILTACGFNMRKLLRAYALCFARIFPTLARIQHDLWPAVAVQRLWNRDREPYLAAA